MKKIEISIIIPIYNVEKYLEECLNSVYNLELVNKEIILVNDGSKDNSLEIAKKYKENYPEKTILINQKNKGLSGARNTGIINSKGEYLFFLDSDDYVDTKELELFLEEGITKKQDILVGNFFYKYENEIKKSTFLNKNIENKTGLYYLKESFKYKMFSSVVWKSLYYKKFLIENELYFKEGLLHEDVLFSAKALYLAKKVGYSNKYFYYYRQTNSTSIMKTLNEKNYLHMLYIVRELIEFQGRFEKENKFYNRIIVTLYWVIIKDGKVKNKELLDKIKNLKINFREKIKLLLIILFSNKAREVGKKYESIKNDSAI